MARAKSRPLTGITPGANSGLVAPAGPGSINHSIPRNSIITQRNTFILFSSFSHHKIILQVFSFFFDEPSPDHLAIVMAGGDHAQEAVGSPVPVEKGFATLNALKYSLTPALL